MTFWLMSVQIIIIHTSVKEMSFYVVVAAKIISDVSVSTPCCFVRLRSLLFPRNAPWTLCTSSFWWACHFSATCQVTSRFWNSVERLFLPLHALAPSCTQEAKRWRNAANKFHWVLPLAIRLLSRDDDSWRYSNSTRMVSFVKLEFPIPVT